jgi:hypothetical protein
MKNANKTTNLIHGANRVGQRWTEYKIWLSMPAETRREIKAPTQPEVCQPIKPHDNQTDNRAEG